ncbi:MAG: hypothetical protein RMN51_05555 [Verrucomicrobiota bacterium]|nr:hypothetical protein [Limisphaera sp.]MDW8381556.1 hypothetical protein [Verrucomicrobiota bacterium]
MNQEMTTGGPTRQARRSAHQRMRELEAAFHAGPSALTLADLDDFEQFLFQQGFAPDSEYFARTALLKARLQERITPTQAEKRDYAGYGAGCWMQVQSVFDHCLLSVCYAGEFRTRPGRIKITHRFNRAGRVDFVEAKLLQSLDPQLHGALRKLITVREYTRLQHDWWRAQAFVLRVLPRELLFLHQEIFRCPREQLLAWLINIGHRTVADLVEELRGEPLAKSVPSPHQLPLNLLPNDPVAWPILQEASILEALVEPGDTSDIHLVRYLRRLPVPAPAEQSAAATC